MMQPKMFAMMGGLAGAVLILACTTQDMPENREGAAIYAENCAMCHGATGRGNGEAAAGMTPAPADLTLLARDMAGRFPSAVSSVRWMAISRAKRAAMICRNLVRCLRAILCRSKPMTG